VKKSIPVTAAILSIFSIFPFFFKADILSWITQQGIPFFSFWQESVLGGECSSFRRRAVENETQLFVESFASRMAVYTTCLDHYENFSKRILSDLSLRKNKRDQQASCV
jgi:hypothetical protein